MPTEMMYDIPSFDVVTIDGARVLFKDHLEDHLECSDDVPVFKPSEEYSFTANLV